jgi:hypothetical protein
VPGQPDLHLVTTADTAEALADRIVERLLQ